LIGIAAYYFLAYCYYGGGRVSTLRFLYKVRYRIGLYDHAMRGAIAECIADRYARLAMCGQKRTGSFGFNFSKAASS
jgi:hypothetical protein